MDRMNSPVLKQREQNRLRMQRVRAAMKAALRAEDMTKGVYTIAADLSKQMSQVSFFF